MKNNRRNKKKIIHNNSDEKLWFTKWYEETENNFCCLDIDFKYTREREKKKYVLTLVYIFYISSWVYFKTRHA